MDLSIVVVSYNVRALTLQCLRSIYQQTQLAFEVILVDSGSTDGTAEAVAVAFPQVALLPQPTNVGFAAGNNLGFRRARGRYVLMLNPDTEIVGNALDALVEFADAHPEAAAFGPRLLNPDRTLQHSCFRFPNLWMAIVEFGWLARWIPLDSPVNGRYPDGNYGRAFEPEHVLGACLLLRREALLELNGLDEGFRMYYEETDLCYRLRRAGKRILYVPDAQVIHYGGQSSGQGQGAQVPIERKVRSLVVYRNSQAYFYRKNYGRLKFAILKLVVMLGLSYWAAQQVWAYARRKIDARERDLWLHAYREVLSASGSAAAR